MKKIQEILIWNEDSGYCSKDGLVWMAAVMTEACELLYVYDDHQDIQCYIHKQAAILIRR